MKDYRHFPISVDRSTDSVIHINDVEVNGLACNCYCAGCGGELVAVTQGVKQRPHFRHHVESNCAFNSFETYLHWLAKGLISTFDRIKLPSIKILDTAISKSAYTKLRSKIEERLKLENIYNDINLNEINSLTLQAQADVIIEGSEIENRVNIDRTFIRPDVTLYSKGRKLFIEPFWSSQIDSIKLQKIQDLDISTVSINLQHFTKNKNYDFTIDEFSNFLKNDTKSKEWVCLSILKVNEMIDNVFGKKFDAKLKELKENIGNYRSTEKVISCKVDAIRKKNIEIFQLQNDVDELSKTLPSISILPLLTK